ncbi:DUF885 domain-containing protein [Myxococcota bacterium]|nr:DUF885 domain-containing protein [Myxococcota bacterium]
MNASLQPLMDELFAHKVSVPINRLTLGLLDGLGELTDPRAEAEEASLRAARSLLERLQALPVEALNEDETIDHTLAVQLLEQELFWGESRFNGRSHLQQTPMAGDELGDGVFLILTNDPRPAEQRLDDIVARLQATPDFLDKMLRRLDTPVARWTAQELQKLDGLPSLHDTALRLAEEVGYPRLDALRAARAEAEAAISRYAEGLRALPTTPHLHIGVAQTERLLRAKGVTLSLDALHNLARRFVARNAAEVETLRARLVRRYGLPDDTPAEALQDELNARFSVELPDGRLEAALDAYEAEHKQILAFIEARDLFPMPQDHELRILRTPPFMAPLIPAGAMMPPPPFRAGTQTSLVYLTLSEALRDEHTTLSIPAMMVHEGIPGHHLQLAWAAGHPSVVRRLTSANDQAEGWTTMLEDWMLDQGYRAELADELRFITKRDIARIGPRVAIDLFFMTGERRFLDIGVDVDVSDPDPFVAAGALLRAVTGFVPERVEAELGWYSLNRGVPLSYLLGNHLVWESKRQLAAAAPQGVDPLDVDRAFHRAFLNLGSMPMALAQQVLVARGIAAMEAT